MKFSSVDPSLDAANLMGKLPSDHAVLIKLAALAELQSNSHEWYVSETQTITLLTSNRFGVAEQALGAIYALAKHPDALCTDIIRRKTKSVFEELSSRPTTSQSLESMNIIEHEEECKEPKDASFFPLSQLLFIVGHVAGLFLALVYSPFN